MTLEAVYEQDFLDCSYGFRPGRSAHQALDNLQHQAVCMAGGWILEINVEKIFDRIDHATLRTILQKRVRDGVVLRLIGKWLNAGVLEEGCVMHPETGTPQGGVISPILANLYLHEVLDTWFAEEMKPRLVGKASMVRYADDAALYVCARRRRQTRTRSAAIALRQVWSDASSDEDASCRISTAGSISTWEWSRSRNV